MSTHSHSHAMTFSKISKKRADILKTNLKETIRERKDNFLKFFVEICFQNVDPFLKLCGDTRRQTQVDILIGRHFS